LNSPLDSCQFALSANLIIPYANWTTEKYFQIKFIIVLENGKYHLILGADGQLNQPVWQSVLDVNVLFTQISMY